MSSGVQTPVGASDADPPRGRAVELGFIPSLDGLRALAVLGVMLYHGEAPILGGGFLTIDVFFVLSGFLITSLLIGEWRQKATIRLRQFWARRARRLLPALVVLLLAVALYTRFVASPDEFATLRWDSISSLFYFANWHFIFTGTNYFDLAAPPSPLQHMWSLSIEEQFYFVWPLVVLLVLRLGRRLRPTRQLWPLLGTAVAGAIASAATMALLYHGSDSVMRVYEGTDTRSQDLLVGAALATAMAIWAQHRRPLPEHRRQPAPGGIRPITAWEITSRAKRAALQLLGWVTVAVYAYLWSHLSGPTAFLFRGGYLLVAVGVAVVIFCSVTNQGGSLARALANPVFRYVGTISYGTYLWHFPLFAVLDAARIHLVGYPLLLVRIAATLLVATGSYYLVEEPVRRGRLRSVTQWRAWALTSGAFVAVVAVTVFATVPQVADAQTSQTSQTSRAGGNGPGTSIAGSPVKVILFGDSVADTVGYALDFSSAPKAYDVDLNAAGYLGCGVVISQASTGHGMLRVPDQYCRSGAPVSKQWPAVWQQKLDSFRPDVTVLLSGRWEVTDQKIGGVWMHIGQPAYDAIVKESLERAVRVGTSTGALMVLETAPCYSSGEQGNGQPWPEDSPVRLRRYDAILAQVADEFPATVTVDDLGAKMCPGGTYQRTLDGVPVRDPDGVHVLMNAASGSWLGGAIFPDVVRVGRLQMAGRNLTGGQLAAPASP